MIVTVVYAGARDRHVLTVDVEPDSTVEQAIIASGLLALEPQLDPGCLKVGIWNRATSLDVVARAGDRIEVYRPLQLDPKEARRIRAEVRRRRRPATAG